MTPHPSDKYRTRSGRTLEVTAVEDGRVLAIERDQEGFYVAWSWHTTRLWGMNELTRVQTTVPSKEQVGG